MTMITNSFSFPLQTNLAYCSVLKVEYKTRHNISRYITLWLHDLSRFIIILSLSHTLFTVDLGTDRKWGFLKHVITCDL